PDVIYEPIEKAMEEDLQTQTDLPGMQLAVDARTWLEHRSRVQNYPATVRWLWAVAGIHSALRQERFAEARARAAILLAAGDQFSIDGGSWSIAREFLLETPPPFSSFSRHTLPDSSELPRSRLLDTRWLEAVMSKLKEVEDFTERRRELQKGPASGTAGGGAADAERIVDKAREEKRKAAAIAAAKERKVAAAAKAKAAAKWRVWRVHCCRKDLIAYHTPSPPSSESAVPGFDRRDYGSVEIGKCHQATVTPAKEVDPERLTFSGRPAFDPLPLLSGETAEIYARPLDHRSEKPRSKPPVVRFQATRRNKLRLFEKLDAAGRLRLFPARMLVQANGLFALVKDLAKGRLIFDARPLNVFEPGLNFWTQTMASATSLLTVYVPPEFDLEFSGDDLRDYYYYFFVTIQSALRNALAGHWRPEDLARLTCYDASLAQEPYLIAALDTMAMGDINAVEVGQAAHMAIAISAGFLMEERGPRFDPRNPVAGVIIDDFVAFLLRRRPQFITTQVLRDEEEQKVFDLNAKFTRLYQAYRDRNLVRHEAKSFSLSSAATFWGAQLDGSSGYVRAPAVRAIPLAALTRKIAVIGFVTASLLEVLGGCWVSIFQFRRRLVSLLDYTYAAQRGRTRHALIRMSPELRNELFVLAAMGPVAASNLRASPAPWVDAVDASGWGLAGVRAPLTEVLALELRRHTLAKGTWARLLAPTLAWSRALGKLGPEDELPGDDELVPSLLWIALAQSLPFKLSWQQRAARKQHINISELQAYLETEIVAAVERPCSRTLVGSDSQVTLGAVTKGRAASPALNFELSVSVPTVLGVLRLPVWFASASAGGFGLLDAALEKEGVLPSMLSGAPRLDDVLLPAKPELRPRSLQRSIAFLQGATWRGKRAEVSEADAVTDVLPADLRRPGETSEALPAVSLPAELRQPGEAPGVLPVGSRRPGKASATPAALPADLRRPGKVAGALPVDSRLPGEASSTPAALPAALRRPGEAAVALPADPRRPGKAMPLLPPHLSVPLSSAVVPPVRTPLHPRGLPALSERMTQKICDGNSHSVFVCRLLRLAHQLGVIFWIENPDSSWLFRQRRWLRFCKRLGVGTYRLDDFCRFGIRWWKRTRFIANSRLRGVVAIAVCLDCDLYPERRRLDIAACARASSLRIGEASHPGPGFRAKQAATSCAAQCSHIELAEVSLFQPGTDALRSQVWAIFTTWLESALEPEQANLLLQVPEVAALLLTAFGPYFFKQGGALYYYRQLLAQAQHKVWGIRSWFRPAWDLVSKWESLEPAQRRPPTLEVLLEAMLSLASNWGWLRWAGVTLLAFCGITRPGEPLAAKRIDLLLPADMLRTTATTVFLRISKPKTRSHGSAKIQHFQVSDSDAVRFVSAVFGPLQASELLYPGSASAYRRRWDALLRALRVPTALRLTPGGLRGGGAVSAYRAGMPITDILWKMRLRHLKTLENYLQEVAAASILPLLPPESRTLISAAAAMRVFTSETVSKVRTAAPGRASAAPCLSLDFARALRQLPVDTQWTSDSLGDLFTGNTVRSYAGSLRPRVSSSAAQPLNPDDFAGTRTDRVDVARCVSRRARGLRQTPRVEQLTHQASIETLERVQGVLVQHFGISAENAVAQAPLADFGFFLEGHGNVGLQQVADVVMALEKEFGVELLTIIASTYVTFRMPEGVNTVQDLAGFIETKTGGQTWPSGVDSPSEDELEGEKLFAEVQALASEVAMRDDYYSQEEGWDFDGLRSDIKLYKRTTADPTTSPTSSAVYAPQADFAGTRTDRVDVARCVGQRATGLRQTPRVEQLTHQASIETLERVQGVLMTHFGISAENAVARAPLADFGFFLEGYGNVGLQQVADVVMALEKEFGVELLTIIASTYITFRMPEGVNTVQDLADFIETKTGGQTWPSEVDSPSGLVSAPPSEVDSPSGSASEPLQQTEDELEGEKLFAEVQALASEIAMRDDYYSEEDGWDFEGLRSGVDLLGKARLMLRSRGSSTAQT
ncbi:unnamed protein product, partial [Polarella glacialis]